MFKKITTLLLALAFVAVFVTPGRSAPRTFDKTVKTELSTKVLKSDIVTMDQADPVVLSCTESTFNILAISELNRPPGVIMATVNYPRINRYKNRDALINTKYNQRLCSYPVPITWRTI